MKNYFDDLYVPMLIVTEPDIDNAVKPTYSPKQTAQEIIQRLSTIDFLAIDDLLTKKYTDSFQDVMFDLIDKRATLKRPTMFSSNVEIKDLIPVMMHKTVDRIAGMSHAVIKIEGDSYRMQERKKEVEF
jgi:DNA replication protein DnaC